MTSIADLFHSEDSAETADVLQPMFAKLGWDASWPKIDSIRRVQSSGSGAAEVPMLLATGEKLGVVWKHGGDRWRITKLNPPKR